MCAYITQRPPCAKSRARRYEMSGTCEIKLNKNLKKKKKKKDGKN